MAFCQSSVFFVKTLHCSILFNILDLVFENFLTLKHFVTLFEKRWYINTVIVVITAP